MIKFLWHSTSMDKWMSLRSLCCRKNSPETIGGKRRCTLNGISYHAPVTPLKLADQFHILTFLIFYLWTLTQICQWFSKIMNQGLSKVCLSMFGRDLKWGMKGSKTKKINNWSYVWKIGCGGGWWFIVLI